ncbi:hypothetical protein LguiA_022738 [Lonicera macranthoides]
MNTLLYNALIRAYLNLNKPRKTILLFTHMLAHQAPPNSHTFPSLIKAASFSPSLASFIGKPLHCQVVKRGVSSDPFIQTSFVGLYAQICNLQDARKVFDEMSQPCLVLYNAMLDALGKNGDMGSAVLLFEQMPERDVVSWTSIINGYGRNGFFVEAIRLFEKMMTSGDVTGLSVKPNEATFVSILHSCANSNEGGALYHGKQIHAYMIKNEIELTVFMGTALIALYGKMACLGYAMELFKQMHVKEENQALGLFDKMRLEKFHPNEVTFVAVLSACAHAKLVVLGLELFQSMLLVFGVVPMMEHYGCVVDLLGRAGLLREANEFIERMPFEADASVLGALLGACKVHGAIEMGNEVARRMLELRPRHCGQYVLMSSIYAGAERWDRAAALRKAMVDAGIQKIPAYSMIGST